MASKQLTLGDCKPGQIVVINDSLLFIAKHFTAGNWTATYEAVEDELVYGPGYYLTTTPCRLATQDELDQLAERIRKAND